MISHSREPGTYWSVLSTVLYVLHCTFGLCTVLRTFNCTLKFHLYYTEPKNKLSVMLNCSEYSCTALHHPLYDTHATSACKTVQHFLPLFCTEQLHFTIAYYTIVYCTAIYLNVLCCTVLYCTVLYCTLLHFTKLYYTALYLPVLTALTKQRAGLLNARLSCERK